MLEYHKKIMLTKNYLHLRANDEIIFMPLSETISTNAYSFTDTISSIIAEGICNNLCPYNIVDLIVNQYEIDRETVENDVNEIISYLILQGVVEYYD